MRARGLQNARPEPGLLYGPLENRLVEMIPALLSRDPVGGNTHCQPDSVAAFGYFCSKAPGRAPPPPSRLTLSNH